MKVVSSLLVVDDNPGDIELCRVACKRTSRYPNIYSARHGEEAIELFERYDESVARYGELFPPRVIFLDINMPRMDGFAFLDAYAALEETLSARGRPPCVICMHTSSNDPRDIARARSYGFVGTFLAKPPTVEDLVALAEQYGEEDSSDSEA